MYLQLQLKSIIPRYIINFYNCVEVTNNISEISFELLFLNSTYCTLSYTQVNKIQTQPFKNIFQYLFIQP